MENAIASASMGFALSILAASTLRIETQRKVAIVGLLAGLVASLVAGLVVLLSL